jgi:hypothetical protein
MSEDGETVDARFLHEGKTIEVKSDIKFPCHMATVDCSLIPDQQLVASMPQRVLNSVAGWWLYRSPAEVGQTAVSSSVKFQNKTQKMVEQVSSVSSVNCDIGLGLFGPIRGDKIGASPRVTPVQTLDPQRVAAATREATVEKEKRSYKEVLLLPAKEVAVRRKKKRWKPTRRKMAHRNQERGGEDRYKREDRSDQERNWDTRRDAAGGGMSRGIINPPGHLLRPLSLDNLCSGSGRLPSLQRKVHGSRLRQR